VVGFFPGYQTGVTQSQLGGVPWFLPFFPFLEVSNRRKAFIPFWETIVFFPKRLRLLWAPFFPGINFSFGFKEIPPGPQRVFGSKVNWGINHILAFFSQFPGEN